MLDDVKKATNTKLVAVNGETNITPATATGGDDKNDNKDSNASNNNASIVHDEVEIVKEVDNTPTAAAVTGAGAAFATSSTTLKSSHNMVQKVLKNQLSHIQNLSTITRPNFETTNNITQNSQDNTFFFHQVYSMCQQNQRLHRQINRTVLHKNTIKASHAERELFICMNEWNQTIQVAKQPQQQRWHSGTSTTSAVKQSLSFNYSIVNMEDSLSFLHSIALQKGFELPFELPDKSTLPSQLHEHPSILQDKEQIGLFDIDNMIDNDELTIRRQQSNNEDEDDERGRSEYKFSCDSDSDSDSSCGSTMSTSSCTGRFDENRFKEIQDILNLSRPTSSTLATIPMTTSSMMELFQKATGLNQPYIPFRFHNTSPQEGDSISCMELKLFHTMSKQFHRYIDPNLSGGYREFEMKWNEEASNRQRLLLLEGICDVVIIYYKTYQQLQHCYDTVIANPSNQQFQQASASALSTTNTVINTATLESRQSKRKKPNKANLPQAPNEMPKPTSQSYLSPNRPNNNVQTPYPYYNQAAVVVPPQYIPTPPLRIMPKNISFRLICAKCGKRRGDHPSKNDHSRGQLFGMELCTFPQCGRCGHLQILHGTCPPGFYCTLISPQTILYDQMIENLVKEVEERKKAKEKKDEVK